MKYHPFPFREKDKKEYVIGEALLRWKGIPEQEVVTLRNVHPDPPDLAFAAKEFGEIRMEITESVPYDRDSEAKSAYFLKNLKAHLKELGTRPPKPSNVFVSREPFDFPPVTRREVKRIAAQIDKFFNRDDFEDKYDIIQDILAYSSITITFIPALGVWAHPPQYYANNLFIHDMTGLPLEKRRFAQSFQAIVESKRRSQTAADILIVFHGSTGSVGLGEEELGQAKNHLTAGLTHQGIYIVEIIQLAADYWVHVVTVREHPVLGRNAVRRE